MVPPTEAEAALAPSMAEAQYALGQGTARTLGLATTDLAQVQNFHV